MYNILVGILAIAGSVAFAALGALHIMRANRLVGRGRRTEMLDAFNIIGVAIALLAIGTYISPAVVLPFDFGLGVTAVIVGWLLNEVKLHKTLLDAVNRLDQGEDLENVVGPIGRWLS